MWAERARPAALAAALATMLAALASSAPAAGPGTSQPRFGLGTPATPEQIAGWDIDVRPDGHGLPPGQGTAEQGEALFARLCAQCHGEFGEGRGRFPALMGGRGSLASSRPVKTVGSFWPYATTLFDYLRRAQPFGHAQSLDDDQVYALAAFVLHLNELVGYDEAVDAAVLTALRMPNRDGFVADDRPDVPAGDPCMRECRGDVAILSRAAQIGVTPQAGALAGADAAGDAERGRALFVRCAACHSLAPGEHRAGPSLHAVIGRPAAAAEGFAGYTAALRASGLTWDEPTLARYLAAPGAVVAGTAMAATGLGGPGEVRDLIAYLRAAAR